eukprot:CAMPEP_0203945590 /NCGR_PEP_ID=MMETSP0359-20131031/81069_1 /ASSEMBLY_ACC=CAM_ASM_000338 /TAXON_ID=268821 /ORGANISM="Scrippsiella Hangoei, Strain SHTV-5" /LENGTH=38 /DNA_ID= /DNA_START= /DNA_END= /DNA_ORIENTATION=
MGATRPPAKGVDAGSALAAAAGGRRGASVATKEALSST